MRSGLFEELQALNLQSLDDGKRAINHVFYIKISDIRTSLKIISPEVIVSGPDRNISPALGKNQIAELFFPDCKYIR